MRKPGFKKPKLGVEKPSFPKKTRFYLYRHNMPRLVVLHSGDNPAIASLTDDFLFNQIIGGKLIGFAIREG